MRKIHLVLSIYSFVLFCLIRTNFTFKTRFVGRISKLPSGFPEPDLRDFCKVLRSANILFDVLNNNGTEKMLVTSKH